MYIGYIGLVCEVMSVVYNKYIGEVLVLVFVHGTCLVSQLIGEMGGCENQVTCAKRFVGSWSTCLLFRSYVHTGLVPALLLVVAG